MTAQQTPPLQTPQLAETGENRHLNEIASQLTQATNSQVKLQDVLPVINQHPLPQFAPPAEVASPPIAQENTNEDKGSIYSPDSDFADFMEGMQGRPRSAPAMDFLKDKLDWMKKKYGGDVKLIKK